MGYKKLLMVTLFAALLAGCGPQATEPAGVQSPLPTASLPPSVPAAAERTLTVMTHDSFDASQAVIAAFQARCNCTVQFLRSGDAGLMLNQALLSQENPLADVIYGVDNTFLSRALAGDILEPYQSPVLEAIPDSLQLDPAFRMLPVDYGDVCLNYDKAWFAERELAPPADLPDLVDPAYRGLTVVENPATSSPGLAFLLTTIGRYGPEAYLDFWANLRANEVRVADGWEDAYYGHFTYASEGDRPIVVSYASSPPVEVYFSEEPFDEAPTGVVTAADSCFRQIEFVGILQGTENRDLAELWIDFMLGPTFQADIPLKMFVFPANETVTLPDVFARFAQVPEEPVLVAPEEIEANREAWIEAWTGTMLR